MSKLKSFIGLTVLIIVLLTFPTEATVKLSGPCDIGYMAKTSVSTATVTVDLELLIIDN